MRCLIVLLGALAGVAVLGFASAPGTSVQAAEVPLQFDPAEDRPSEQEVLFTDSPGDPEQRRAVLKEVKAATPEERSAVVAFLKACIAYDHNTHVNKRPADIYYRACKRAIDAWRLAHGRSNPKRQIDKEVDVFLKIIKWLKISAEKIDQTKCGRFAACSPEARDLFSMTNPPDLSRLGEENYPYLKRSQLFVEGLIEIIQETR